MRYLIDGHNLIHVMPGMSLADEHDEAELVEKLKSFSGRTRSKVIVIFDHGLPGGKSHDLSTGQVEVRFAAASHTNADTLIKKRIRATRDPQQITVVSSDREVLAVADGQRMPVMTSEQFVLFMAEKMAPAPDDSSGHDVHLTPAEVDEWMRLFKKGKK